MDHVFLPCTFSLQLWWKLFREIKSSWHIPKGCFEFLNIKFVRKIFGDCRVRGLMNSGTVRFWAAF